MKGNQLTQNHSVNYDDGINKLNNELPITENSYCGSLSLTTRFLVISFSSIVTGYSLIVSGTIN